MILQVKKCNGRITPQAPIVITGHHLDMLTWDSANLYLVSSVNDRMLIECGDIHKYSDDKVYTTIPDIDEGEYFLALMILMKDKESFLLYLSHIFDCTIYLIKMSRLTYVYIEARNKDKQHNRHKLQVNRKIISHIGKIKYLIIYQKQKSLMSILK